MDHFEISHLVFHIILPKLILFVDCAHPPTRDSNEIMVIFTFLVGILEYHRGLHLHMQGASNRYLRLSARSTLWLRRDKASAAPFLAPLRRY